LPFGVAKVPKTSKVGERHPNPKIVDNPIGHNDERVCSPELAQLLESVNEPQPHNQHDKVVEFVARTQSLVRL
jgi:hypothetical protein